MDHPIPIPDDLASLTTEQALDALTAINTALAPVHEAQMALQVIATAPSRVEQAAVDYAAAIGRQDGDPWAQPLGAHDAYAPGSIVSDDDGYYRATSWTSHPPGTTGAPWERVWADGDGWTTTPPADAGPLAWAVGIVAVAGETVLSHEGRLWRAKVSHSTHVGWVPSAATYAVWEDIGPA